MGVRLDLMSLILEGEGVRHIEERIKSLDGKAEELDFVVGGLCKSEELRGFWWKTLNDKLDRLYGEVQVEDRGKRVTSARKVKNGNSVRLEVLGEDGKWSRPTDPAEDVWILGMFKLREDREFAVGHLAASVPD